QEAAAEVGAEPRVGAVQVRPRVGQRLAGVGQEPHEPRADGAARRVALVRLGQADEVAGGDRRILGGGPQVEHRARLVPPARRRPRMLSSNFISVSPTAMKTNVNLTQSNWRAYSNAVAVYTRLMAVGVQELMHTRSRFRVVLAPSLGLLAALVGVALSALTGL